MGQWAYTSFVPAAHYDITAPSGRGTLTYTWTPAPGDPVSVPFQVTAIADLTNPTDVANFSTLCEVAIQTAGAVAAAIGALNAGPYH